MILTLFSRDRVHMFCFPGFFFFDFPCDDLSMVAGFRRSANSPASIPLPTVVFDRSLESGILLNDVSPIIPVSETLGVLFRFLACRCRPRWEAVSGDLTTEPIRLPSYPAAFNAVPM